MPILASTVKTVPEQGVKIKKRWAEDRFGRTVSEYCSPTHVSQHAYQQFSGTGSNTEAVLKMVLTVTQHRQMLS